MFSEQAENVKKYNSFFQARGWHHLHARLIEERESDFSVVVDYQTNNYKRDIEGVRDQRNAFGKALGDNGIWRRGLDAGPWIKIQISGTPELVLGALERHAKRFEFPSAAAKTPAPSAG